MPVTADAGVPAVSAGTVLLVSPGTAGSAPLASPVTTPVTAGSVPLVCAPTVSVTAWAVPPVSPAVPVAAWAVPPVSPVTVPVTAGSVLVVSPVTVPVTAGTEPLVSPVNVPVTAGTTLPGSPLTVPVTPGSTPLVSPLTALVTAGTVAPVSPVTVLVAAGIVLAVIALPVPVTVVSGAAAVDWDPLMEPWRAWVALWTTPLTGEATGDEAAWPVLDAVFVAATRVPDVALVAAAGALAAGALDEAPLVTGALDAGTAWFAGPAWAEIPLPAAEVPVLLAVSWLPGFAVAVGFDPLAEPCVAAPLADPWLAGPRVA